MRLKVLTCDNTKLSISKFRRLCIQLIRMCTIFKIISACKFKIKNFGIFQIGEGGWTEKNLLRFKFDFKKYTNYWEKNKFWLKIGHEYCQWDV